ncbi:MAG: methyltransferase domain-containing protein, partial [Anaerolineae bacterium]|nr:methyltransferase domain-containing protein [Anaerolineae bacterium]
RRAYKGSHRPGSLKPPIAAALLRLAHGDRIIDPLCGSGTIAIEAALRGKTVIAGDHDLDAVIAARHNALEAVVNLPVIRADARRLPLESASQHSVISNLPWGRQIVLNEALSAFYRAVISEMQRVATDRIVVLTAFPELLPVDDQIEQREISLFGQTPSIVVFHNR